MRNYSSPRIIPLSILAGAPVFAAQPHSWLCSPILVAPAILAVRWRARSNRPARIYFAGM